MGLELQRIYSLGGTAPKRLVDPRRVEGDIAQAMAGLAGDLARTPLTEEGAGEREYAPDQDGVPEEVDEVRMPAHWLGYLFKQFIGLFQTRPQEALPLPEPLTEAPPQVNLVQE